MREKIGYMAVSADKYELPIAVFSNIPQMAQWAGCSPNTIKSMITRGQIRRKGVPGGCKFIRFKEEQ